MFKKSLVFSLVSLMACACISCSDDDDDKQEVDAVSCAKVGKNFDPVKKECVDRPAASGGCTSASTAKCTDACDGNKKWYWNGTKVASKDCYDCKMENGQTKCGKAPDCVEGGTAYCTKVCNADKSAGFYYTQGTVEKKVCANKDCTIIGDRIVCESEVERCEKATYAKVCDQGNKSYNFCNNDGIVQKANCEGDAYCKVSGTNNSYISCVTDCTSSSTAQCEAACDANGKAGYYWNNTQGQLVTKTCTASQKCQLAGTSINCVATDLVGQECTGTKCSTVDGNPYFCDLESKSYYYDGKSNCANDKCGVCTDGYGGCGFGEGGSKSCATDGGGGHDTACTGDKLTTGGVAGNCCDSLNYKHTCSADKKTLYRCRSWGKVETLNCSKSDCAVDENNRYTCEQPK